MKSKTDQMDKTDNGDNGDNRTISSEILTENFATITKANGGIKKLRELILQLAVQGKLVPQNPDDEPASVLLEKIKDEKQNLIRTGKIKKQKPLPPVEEDEIPYALPDGWIWTRLGDNAINIHYGYTASANESLKNVRLLRITDIQNNSVNWSSVPGCEINQKNFETYKLNNRDLLIARTGGTVGKSYLVENIPLDAVFASYLIRIIPCTKVSERFLRLFSGSPTYWNQLYSKCTGTGQPNVNGQPLKNMYLPLPPLAEQHRIVERVDCLMKLCDDLEARQESESENRRLLLLSVLKNLEDAGRENEKQEAWEILSGRFDDLINSAEDVKELRKTVLQLAVQGRLVPQNPEDEPASLLLEKIQAEKQNLIKTGQIKKQKALPPIAEDEVPYELPEGWIWTRLGNTSTIVMGNSPPGSTYNSDGEGCPLINGPVEFSSGDFGKTIKSKYTTSPTKLCKEGDLLICVRGSTTGRTNIAGFESCIGRGVALIRPHTYTEYIYQYIHSCKNIIYNKGTGSTFPSISQNILTDLILPLPPLAEQHRIVERVDCLMKLCDELEERVVAREEAAERLLSSVCAGICG